MRVIGTAGHVDHGKSTLVEALTGTHPDRLKEEKARQMTIDLGFAWVTLPDGQEIGIVDVPGHRDFIENMLAGVGGIDSTLFIVAADEGIMPQTREHLAILDLLGISSGIIVITKIDLVDDPQWLELVEDEVNRVVKGTFLEKAPVVRVSAFTREGIPQLLATLSEVLRTQPPKADLSRPRLPIDRVFTISGFGTVVTGTLLDGKFIVGDEIEVLPSGYRGRIRGLQTHKNIKNIAEPGSRTAVNISGLDVDRLKRGDVVIHPGTYNKSQRLDVHFQMLRDASLPLKHNQWVKLFVGSTEVPARVRIMEKDELAPGDMGWLQLESVQPVVVTRGDRYILRRPSPAETLGGGEILDPHPARRYKRFSAKEIQRYKSLRDGSPADLLYQVLLGGSINTICMTIDASRLEKSEAVSALKDLLDLKKVILLEEGEIQPEANNLIISDLEWEKLIQRTRDELRNFHLAFPLRRGMPREELKSRLKLTNRDFLAVLRIWIAREEVQEKNSLVSLYGHQPHFNEQESKSVEHLLRKFSQFPYSPPSIKECLSEVGNEVYHALVEKGMLVPVSEEVVFTKDAYNRLVQDIMDYLTKNETLTVAQFRDRYNTSRKYAVAFLEHLDAIGITFREGEFRKFLGKRP